MVGGAASQSGTFLFLWFLFSCGLLVGQSIPSYAEFQGVLARKLEEYFA